MKHTFLVEVHTDPAEHQVLNDKRLRGGRQQRTIEDEITFLISDALQNKFTTFTHVQVAPATPAKP
jgi:hypothetical protein